MKLQLKAIFGRFIGLEFCEDCGKRNKAVYTYTNDDGDNECCYKCDCGSCWHTADHMGM